LLIETADLEDALTIFNTGNNRRGMQLADGDITTQIVVERELDTSDKFLADEFAEGTINAARHGGAAPKTTSFRTAGERRSVCRYNSKNEP
jgi:hypothetical protein